MGVRLSPVYNLASGGEPGQGNGTLAKLRTAMVHDNGYDTPINH